MEEFKELGKVSPNLIFYGNYCAVTDSLDEVRLYLTEFQKHINQRIESLKSEKKLEHNKYQVENLEHHYHYSFSSLLYDSSIISIYSILEIEIGNYCLDFRKNINSTLSISEFKGDLLGRFKIYSKKVIESDFDFNSFLWQYIVGLQELRNCLVHNRGQSEGFSKLNELREFLKKNDKIVIGESGFVEVSHDACLDVLDHVQKFFKEITNVALKKFPGAYTAERLN